MPLVAVGDYVWIDSDNDGVQDPGELPLAGVTVTRYLADTGALATNLDGSPATAVTDANGFYLIDALLAGRYDAEFSIHAGFVMPGTDRVVEPGRSGAPQRHQEHLAPRESEDSWIRVLGERIAALRIEGERRERSCVVVQSNRAELVPGSDDCDGRLQFRVEQPDRVHVFGGVPQAMPGEERTADDDVRSLRPRCGKLIGNLVDEPPDVVAVEEAIGRHVGTGCRSRHRAETGNVMFRAANSAGVSVTFMACLRGVAGALHGVRSGGKLFVHAGCLIPASLASFSAVAASRLSMSGDPDGSGA